MKKRLGPHTHSCLYMKYLEHDKSIIANRNAYRVHGVLLLTVEA